MNFSLRKDKQDKKEAEYVIFKSIKGCPPPDKVAGLKGFTLAEVLITLGIIGVVAALTIPNIIGHYKKVETSSRLKKFYSIMEQAIRMSEIEYGDSKEWFKASTQYDDEGNVDYDAQGKVTKEFFMTYLAPYFKYTNITEGRNTVDEEGNKKGTITTVYLADGTYFSFNNGACMDFAFDTNGYKKPNEMGRDKFAFLMCFSEWNRLYFCGSNQKAFCAYGSAQNVDNTREKRLADCKKSGYWCSGLLLMDNFEFKDDYPYKL